MFPTNINFFKPNCMPASHLFIDRHGLLTVESPETGTLTLREWRIQPLCVDDLIRFQKSETLEILLFDVVCVEDPSITQIRLALVLPDHLKVYCIVPDGWLPPGLAVQNARILADRNFISKITECLLDGKPKREGLEDWVVNLPHSNTSMDVLHFAMEANKKELPTQDLVRAQIAEAKEKISKAMPAAKIEEYNNISLEDYAWKLLEHLRPKIIQRMKFFKEAAPFLKATSSVEVVLTRWTAIIERAASASLEKRDIGVIVAMLAVSAPQKDSIGLGIIKPNGNYTDKQAHNAAFDISLFELFINFQKNYPTGNYVIATSDADLAKLGALLGRPTQQRSDGATLSMTRSIGLSFFGGREALAAKFHELVG